MLMVARFPGNYKISQIYSLKEESKVLAWLFICILKITLQRVSFALGMTP